MTLKIRAILVVVIGVVMGWGLSVGGSFVEQASAPTETDEALEKARLLAEVMERVKRDYVEPIDDAELLESAIRGMVRDLDAHSEYLDASEYRDIRVSTTGSYTGVGVEVAEVDGRLLIITPIAGSPAALAGIRRGDELLAVDGRAVDPGDRRGTLQRLRGQAGSRVKLTVRRDDEAIDYRIRRQIIRMASVHRKLLKPNYGYVRLAQFNENTARELSRSVDELQEENDGMLDGLVIDLRDNPGGVLDSAVDVTDLFLDAGIIVSAEGRSADARFRRSAHRGDILDGSPIVVLVNSGSASASEIVAGALQDHGRATIVGTETFGKGLVQTVMPLSRGRAIKLTTSRYYTPSGDSIQDVGIQPDVWVDDTPGFPNFSLSGDLDREADRQLAEAMAQLEPRLVMHSGTQ